MCVSIKLEKKKREDNEADKWTEGRSECILTSLWEGLHNDNNHIEHVFP